jgi:hypothetical protein
MAFFPLKKVGYLLFIPIYFILHNGLLYYHVVDFRNLAGWIALWLALPIVLFQLLQWRYKQRTKTAGLLTAFYLLFFFFYSPVYNALYHTPYLQFLVKISVLLSLLALSLIVVFFFHRRLQLEASRLPTLLTLIFGVLIFFDVSTFVLRGGRNPSVLQPEHVLDTSGLVFQHHPDVYYLIFDEHVAAHAAKQYLGIDNRATDSLLQLRNFHISSHSVSAYTHTTISLAANFWTSVFKENRNKKVELTNYQLALYNLEKNPVVPVLLRNGYSIINTADYKIYETEPGVKKQHHFGNIEQIVLNQTFANRIVLQIQGIVYDRFPHLLQQSERFRSGLQAGQENILQIRNNILKAARSTSAQPKFVYAHFPVPHLPILFDSSMQPLSAASYLQYNKKMSDTAAFAQNLLVARKFMLELADSILANRTRPAIVIIQSDHGYRGRTV